MSIPETLSKGDLRASSFTSADKVSLSLYLANFMKLACIATASPSYGLTERVTYEVCTGRREIFNPISNLEQFAQVLLEGITSGFNISLDDNTSPCYRWFFPGKCRTSIDAEWRRVYHDDSKEQVQLALLAVIALADGWRPENYEE